MVRLQLYPDYFQKTHSKVKKKTSDYESTHENGTVLIPIFVWFSSSISCFRPENVSYKWTEHVWVIKLQRYPGCFQNTHSKVKTNIRLWMYTPNGTVWYPFCLAWSIISCFRSENVSYTSEGRLWVIKLHNRYLGSLQNTHSKIENKHQIMNVHTKWNCFDYPFLFYFGQILAVSGQKTLAIRNRHVWVIKSQLYLGSLQNTHSKIENKHQIMNVHTKWNCLIPILSTLVKY